MGRLRAIFQNVRGRLRGPHSGWRVAAAAAALAIAISALYTLLGCLAQNLDLWGLHDWDTHVAYRYITVISIKKYGELPWWHPWFCGGIPAFGYIEAATNLVSPYLIAHLLLPQNLAGRVEVVGSAVTGLLTAYLLAGRYTRSHALRLLVGVAYALNGRWAAQAATGHTWHLQYAWLPLVFFYFERSLEPARLRSAIYAGLVIALIVYSGGVYPLPHAALALCLYAGARALGDHSWRPVVALAVAGGCSLGFSAPKLFAVMDMMTRYPRIVASTEFLDMNQVLAVFTDGAQSLATPPVTNVVLPYWGFHEYAMYVGWPVFILMVFGMIGGGGSPGFAYKLIGLLFFVLGMGAFHRYAPWTLLHLVPPFSSQHVPSRFQHPSVLFLLMAFVAWVGPIVDRWLGRRPTFDLLALAGMYFVAADIATVSARSTADMFSLHFPVVQRQKGDDVFHHAAGMRANYPDSTWAGSMALSMDLNEGVLKCYGTPIIEPEVASAVAKGSPEYRGEAHFADGRGNAAISEWTPNRARVVYAGARPGDIVVYNMNWDSSWRANGRPAIAWKGRVAAQVDADHGTVHFTYYPRTMNAALCLLGLTCALCFGRQTIRRTRRVGSRLSWWVQVWRHRLSHRRHKPRKNET